MTSPGFVVRGKGNHEALNSAAHGAGRMMSRRQAMRELKPDMLRLQLEKYGVELIGSGLDEAPMVYKDIHQVMQHQQDLVEIIARFQPRIVRMDGPLSLF
jgi:tRNA-splicing ligase RtcB